MKVSLEIKKRCEFFWLRAISSVNIKNCCAKCFNGERLNEVYYATLRKDKAFVEFDLNPSDKYRAYYLCGLAKGFKYEDNTHVAFVPCAGQNIEIDNDRIRLTITGAKQIMFEGYVPHPKGEYTHEQRTCRNWIFANYIKDEQPL